MAVVKADLDRVPGIRATASSRADDVFDIDDDGVVVLLRDEIPEADRARVEEAARSCPVSALSIED